MNVAGRLLGWGATLLLGIACLAGSAQRSEGRAAAGLSVFVGSDGLVHIREQGGAEFVAPKEPNPWGLDPQESVDSLRVAEDGRTVGWTVNFPNCCTSYPIPLLVVVYRGGRIVQRFTPVNGRPTMFAWAFVGGGRQVAYYSDTLHGEADARCELRDVTTGRLAGAWTKKDGAIPGWAAPFRDRL